ncbi:acyltransferase family protein [Citrobacter freundii]|uniref:acyltransferase family protein n=1 Tax=Citrobacter freundii TaxID=546 RepID=UPI0018C58E2A
MKFRKDINGLRAIAVLAVVLYHFGIRGFGGGFVGVDVFFVISGFLMTGIIVNRISEDKFSLIGFYLDRARRIVPALSVLCTILIVICWFFLIPVDFESLGKHVSSSVAFLSNIVYYNEINYFDASAKEKWLLHTWSLSVEWQFYIIYPLIILALSRFAPIARVKKILILFLLASFASSVYLSDTNPASSFYLLHSRAWEMIAGGLVYLYPLKLSNKKSFIIKYTGLIGIFSCIVLMSSFMVWPGYLAALPVVSTVAILYSSNVSSYVTDNPISQFIGKISYSVYLWHWPVVVGLSYFSLVSGGYKIAGILLSIFIGAISFYIVESPFSKLMKKYNSMKVAEISSSAAVMAIPFLIGATVYNDNGVPSRYPFALITSDEINSERARYWLEGDKPHPAPKTGDKKVLIIGNSHGIDLTYSLMESGFKGDITYIRTTNMCSNFGYTPNTSENISLCTDVFNSIKKFDKWSEMQEVILHDDWAEENISDLKKMIVFIKSVTNAKIYIFGPKMIFDEIPSKIVVEAMKEKMSTVGMINSYSHKYYQARRARINNEVKKEISNEFYERAGVYYIDFLNVQCGESLICDIINPDNKKFIYFDSSHFTLDGAKIFGDKLKSLHPEIYN